MRLLLVDKPTKEEEDINKLCLDLRKTSVSPQPCRQTLEVSSFVLVLLIIVQKV